VVGRVVVLYVQLHSVGHTPTSFLTCVLPFRREIASVHPLLSGTAADLYGVWNFVYGIYSASVSTTAQPLILFAVGRFR